MMETTITQEELEFAGEMIRNAGTLPPHPKMDPYELALILRLNGMSIHSDGETRNAGDGEAER